jgi:UMF1 family MFS transporter
MWGKFAAFMGPFLVGFFGQLFRDTGAGVLSLIELFITGIVLLTRVKETSA